MQKHLIVLCLTCLFPFLSRAQSPNHVVEWNRALLRLLRTPGAQPATIHPTRNMAILHVAIYEAVNSIDHSHTAYRSSIPVLVPGASQEAAADSAAFTVLNSLYPSQTSVIDTTYQQLLSGIPDGPAKQEGIRIGTAAASELLTLRSNDHSGDPSPTIPPGTTPGAYRPTPPNDPKPVFTGWGNVDPFALAAGNQFRPGPPPALTSPTYTGDFDEVKADGVPHSTAITPEQQLAGWFWGGAIQNYWNEIAQTAALAKALNTAQSARLFALLDVSLADTVVALYDAKYTYLLWRPVTAIHEAGTDGNPNTAPQADWLPETKTTAADPSYPGAHASISWAAATVLADVLGDDAFTFKVTSEVFAGVQRSFAGFSAAADEATVSRIYSGQHFRFDLIAGQHFGTQVAQFADGSLFQPVAQ